MIFFFLSFFFFNDAATTEIYTLALHDALPILAKERGCGVFKYAVICHERNDKLSDNGNVFLEFKKLLRNPNHLKIIYLSDIKQSFELLENDFPDITWTKEFTERYCI